jgi:hypothetical protein
MRVERRFREQTVKLVITCRVTRRVGIIYRLRRVCLVYQSPN